MGGRYRELRPSRLADSQNERGRQLTGLCATSLHLETSTGVATAIGRSVVGCAVSGVSDEAMAGGPTRRTRKATSGTVGSELLTRGEGGCSHTRTADPHARPTDSHGRPAESHSGPTTTARTTTCVSGGRCDNSHSRYGCEDKYSSLLISARNRLRKRRATAGVHIQPAVNRGLKRRGRPCMRRPIRPAGPIKALRPRNLRTCELAPGRRLQNCVCGNQFLVPVRSKTREFL